MLGCRLAERNPAARDRARHYGTRLREAESARNCDRDRVLRGHRQSPRFLEMIIKSLHFETFRLHREGYRKLHNMKNSFVGLFFIGAVDRFFCPSPGDPETGTGPQRHEFVIAKFTDREAVSRCRQARVVWDPTGPERGQDMPCSCRPFNCGFSRVRNADWGRPALADAKLFLWLQNFLEWALPRRANTPYRITDLRFPVTHTIADNVLAGAQLADRGTEGNALARDHRIFSMGAQQTFQWSGELSKFRGSLAATAGTAKT